MVRLVKIEELVLSILCLLVLPIFGEVGRLEITSDGLPGVSGFKIDSLSL